MKPFFIESQKYWDWAEKNGQIGRFWGIFGIFG
jgi:hypothetical protein